MGEGDIPAVAWLAGGLALTLLSRRSRHDKPPPDDRDTESFACPDSPRSEKSEQTKRWLHDQLTPQNLGSEGYHIKASRGTSEAIPTQPQRLLAPGTLVCFYDSTGSLLVSKRGAKEHILEPVPAEFHKETGSVSFLPTSAIFVVVREGILTGFKVYSGDDLLLQAAKSQDEPHKIKRTRLGDSEKWRLTSSGYVNSRWNKALDMEIKELRCVLVEDMRRYERRHVKDKGAMEEQIQYHVSREQYLGDEISTLRSNLDQQEKENETKRQRLHDLQQTCYRLRVDSEQKAAVIAQLENRLADSSMRIQAAEKALDAEARLSMQYKNASDMISEHSKKNEAALHKRLAQEAERVTLEEERLQSRFQKREEQWKQSVGQAEQDSMRYQNLLKSVSEERDRLDAALQRISGQMDLISAPHSRRASDLDFDQNKLKQLKEMLEEAQRSRDEGQTNELADKKQNDDENIQEILPEQARSPILHFGPQRTSSNEAQIPSDSPTKSDIRERRTQPEMRKTEQELDFVEDVSSPEVTNFEQSPEQAKSKRRIPVTLKSTSGNSELVSMMASGLSLGSQKLRIFLEDDSPQASSQYSVATPKIMTSQEFAKAVQEAQSKLPESVNSSHTTFCHAGGEQDDENIALQKE